MFRQGVHIDSHQVETLTRRYRSKMDALTERLRQEFADVLTYNKDGTLRVTPKGQTPSLVDSKLLPMLQRVAENIEASGQPFVLPQSHGKKGGISKSVKGWQKYVSQHPFLQIWAEMKRIEKLLGFLADLHAPVMHCKYALLTRTGRTACSRPQTSNLPGVNLQQLPKDAEFRAVVVPPDADRKLFIADYAAIELRTLAAVCRARFGHSKLGDVIEAGTDPHAFTAAAIQGLALDEFMELRQTDREQFRQRRQSAKALNFGVPGGLGAPRLQEYAEASFGVHLTLDEAEQFRSRLISQIYPELNDKDGYLADQSMKALAVNLGASEAQVWQMLDRKGKRSPIAARGVAKVIRGESTASAGYQDFVWDALYRLARASNKVSPELLEQIRRRQGSLSLRDRLYHQKVASLTGRIRDGVGYTDSKNTPFQSLAADGAKLALWNLLYEGYDVCGFVHDEILVSIPATEADQDALRIKQIMINAMNEVLGTVPADCAYTVSDCWTKPD